MTTRKEKQRENREYKIGKERERVPYSRTDRVDRPDRERKRELGTVGLRQG